MPCPFNSGSTPPSDTPASGRIEPARISPDNPTGMPTTKAQKLTYTSYLGVDTLLTLQNPLSKPEHHDELLFIISHQVYELWFKQMLHELAAIAQHIDHDRLNKASQLFERVLAIQHLLIEQIPLLETMFGVEFNKFRDHLRPASGFQSVQFRLVEFLSGARNEKLLALVGDDEKAQSAMRAALTGPTLFDHLLGSMARAGLAIPADVLGRDTAKPYAGDDRVAAAIAPVYQNADAHYDLFRLCEHFVAYDERLSIWRFHHVKMVERMIGSMTGTGGSAGAKYLMSTVANTLFPDLWNVRNHLGGKY